MNLETLSPPQPTGNNEKDIAALTNWCKTLNSRLKATLCRLDGGNITDIPADKISGTIKNAETVTDDGEQYIRIEGGKLVICADTIKCRALNPTDE